MKKFLTPVLCVILICQAVLTGCGASKTSGAAGPAPQERAEAPNTPPGAEGAENVKTNPAPPAAEIKTEADAETSPPPDVLITFETDDGGFTDRGDSNGAAVPCSVARSKDFAHEGEYSLYVYGRTKGWMGATKDVTALIKKGAEYELTVWVYVPETEKAAYFMLSAQTDFGGASSYKQLDGSGAKATIRPGKWTKLHGTVSFTNYEAAHLYVETNDSGGKTPFYIDDVSLTKVGEEFELVAEDIPSLKNAYKDMFLIGFAGEYNLFEPDSASFNVIKRHFSAVTPENSMKPAGIQGGRGAFNFTAADGLNKAAKENGLTLIGHTLCWHQQSPDWMNKGQSREAAIKNLTEHIKETVSHFGADVYSWDVVNEAVNDNISGTAWRKNLRETNWKSAIGDDYIEIAFRAAREANPDVLLYYNDYNLDSADKREIVYAMVKELKAAGVPIDGVGMQGHYNTGTSAGAVEKSIERFAELGVKVSITELDVTSPNARGSLTDEQETEQAVKYAQLFQVFKKHKNVIERVTLWGISDASSWRGDKFPLLFDKTYKAKKAFYAALDPDGFLAENAPDKPKAAVKTAKALYGSFVLGGDVSAFDKCEAIPADNFILAWQGASGAARVLWDENNLYVRFDVYDPVLNNASATTYQQDSVEIFIDENNAKTDVYEGDDFQIRVSFANALSFDPNLAPENGEIKTTAERTADGYRVVAQIPFQTIKGEEGAKIGFDLQVNDADESGKRVSIAKWNDLTDHSYRTTEGFGELILGK